MSVLNIIVQFEKSLTITHGLQCQYLYVLSKSQRTMASSAVRGFSRHPFFLRYFNSRKIKYRKTVRTPKAQWINFTGTINLTSHLSHRAYRS